MSTTEGEAERRTERATHDEDEEEKATDDPEDEKETDGTGRQQADYTLAAEVITKGGVELEKWGKRK